MNILAFISASDTKLSDGALYAVIGFVVVLAVLALLVGIFYLMGFIFKTKALSKEKLFERKSKPKTENRDISTESESDEELYAVISAVISTIYDEEASGDNVKPDFVIRRIKRSK